MKIQTIQKGTSIMKRLLGTIAAMGVVASGTGVADAANVLFNPNLDQTAVIITQPDGLPGQNNPCPIGWNVDATKSISGQFFDGGDSETFCNVSPPSDPAGFGFFFKPFQGIAGPPADLLSVDLTQDNSATPGTMFTLSGYAAAEVNYSGFFATNSPAPQTLFIIYFLNNSGSIIGSNAFNLVTAGLPNTGAGSMASFQYTTPSVTAPPNTAVVRAGVSMRNVYGTTGAQSFFVDSFDLEATAPPGSPVITTNPISITVAPGATAKFTVVSTGATSFQWQHSNTNISNGGEYSGVNSATLTITGSAVNDLGHYRVLLSNGSGSVYSSDATLAFFTVAIDPVLTLSGRSGDTYRVDYSTALNPTTWIPLSTNKLTTLPLQVVDPAGVGTQRFYRAVFLF